MIVHGTMGYVDLNAGLPVPVTMTYDETDPLAVTVTFHRSEHDPAEWTFARELLAHGLAYETGEGALRVGPRQGFMEGGVVVFSIVGANSAGETIRGTVAVPRNDVRTFMQATGHAVPFGSEDRAITAALDDFLATFR